MYEIRLACRAARYYQRVDADTARRLDERLDQLTSNPFAAGDVPVLGRSPGGALHGGQE